MKRANGQGSKPTQRADGRWRAYVTVPDGQGGSRRRYVYAPTRPLCEDKLRALLNEAEAGTLVAGPDVSLGAWLAHYLDEIAAPRLRPRTLNGYRSYVRTWITGTRLESKPLRKVTPEDLDALYARMVEAGRSSTTCLQLHRILSRAFKVAVRRGRLAVSPTSRMDAPSAARYEAQVLSVDEARRLITAAKLDPVRGVGWMLALALGLRQGERLGLGWDVVDLDAGTVVIKRALLTLPKDQGGAVFGPPKAGERLVVLAPELVEALRAHRDFQLASRAEDWAPYTDRAGVTVDLVFCRTDGVPEHSRTDYGRWHRFLDSAGVERVRVHDARHTAATVLLLMGVDSRVVMQMLGWSQVSMLARYQHVVDELQRDAASAVAGALFAAPVSEPSPPAEGGVVSLDAFRARRSG